MLTNEQIQIRDPYVFVDRTHGKYYMYGSTDANIWGPGTGFDVYVGGDLHHWEGPFSVFRPDADFYAEENFWAPEVHLYRGRYYMFATFLRKDNGKRGTAILQSDSLLGPFLPHSEGPVTPKDWFSLDGTLHVDEAGKPWMVFCHEWVQVTDGQICAVRLQEDLHAAEGEPIVLFSASDAPWPTSLRHPRYPNRDNYVTDGPYMYRASNGEWLLLWASFVDQVYAQGISRSASGTIRGPWMHEPAPIFRNDGGHGMLFRSLEDRLYLTLHAPNKTPFERPLFIEMEEREGSIAVKKEAL